MYRRIQPIWVICCFLFLLAGHTHGYNLPSGMCMRPKFMFLSTVIPGLSSPGWNIDVCLQPLIDELAQLWSFGALTYDISRKQNFVTRSASMWIINDFPAYGMLSGWSTHEKLACPYCMENNKAFTLTNGGKAFFFLLSPSFLTTWYKYHLSCTLHYHQHPYRRTHIRRYFTES